jgi:hypothetical protein
MGRQRGLAVREAHPYLLAMTTTCNDYLMAAADLDALAECCRFDSRLHFKLKISPIAPGSKPIVSSIPSPELGRS